MEHHQSSIAEGQDQGLTTSGSNISFWLDSVEPIRFTPLASDLRTDVVVVGGGLAGLSIAYSLIKAGKKVIVLEDGFVGSGETGRTTAHITNILDERYSEIEQLLGEDKCRHAAASHTEAINFIERVVEEEHIDCDFRRVEGFLFLHPNDTPETLDKELAAVRRYGLQVEMLPKVPGITGDTGPCLRFPGQAQFHPLKYLRGLAHAIVRHGGEIFTETRVEEIGAAGVRTNGFVVAAEHVVVATHTPVNNMVTMHTKQFPYRTYVIGALIPKDSVTHALWWDTGSPKSAHVNDPYHYVRINPYDEHHDVLIAGGEDHKTGQADNGEATAYSLLEDWARKRFPSIKEIVYRWSGQVMEPVDILAFIGKNPGDHNIYIATGDSGNGMTHAAIAGMLISDLITGRANAWERLYDPSRITLKAASTFLQEAGNMSVQYLDYFRTGDLTPIEKLKPGQGEVVNMNGKRVAIYRDESEDLYAFSAICPHLGCILRWNQDEKSFDCPCHGSRFTCRGVVVNGPAKDDLQKLYLRPKEPRE